MTNQEQKLYEIEQELVHMASMLDEKESIFAMKLLQDYFDKTYHWSVRLEGAAITRSDENWIDRELDELKSIDR